MFKPKDYRITHRTKLFDLSKMSKWESIKDIFKVNSCPICGKTPKGFYECRFIKDEDEKWIYDGIYVIVQCRHFQKKLKTEKKCETIIPRALLDAIIEWNKIT